MVLLLLRQDPSKWHRLALNSQCMPGWHQTHDLPLSATECRDHIHGSTHPDSHHILKYIDYYFKYVGREMQSNSCELSNFIPSTFTSESHAFPTNMKCFLVCLSIIKFLVFLVSTSMADYYLSVTCYRHTCQAPICPQTPLHASSISFQLTITAPPRGSFVFKLRTVPWSRRQQHLHTSPCFIDFEK